MDSEDSLEAEEPIIGVAARAAGHREKPRNPRRQSAEQAILGILDGGVDDKQISARLDKLPAADLDRLARLTAIARAGQEAPPAPLVDRLAKQLDGRLIHLEIGGNNNSVTIDLGQERSPAAAGWRNRGDGPPSRWKDRRDWSSAGFRNSWGRRVAGPLKGFLNGR
ncbi:MAG TPA: hypothetical protein HPQ04_02725 [Rhodospirillaceae bacterium]|nr:hypothetical protein [Rhodospirillaceae bacterium]